MRRNCSKLQRLCFGRILLLALVIVVPVAPAMALPVYDLSGPLSGSVTLDMTATAPYVEWHITDGTYVWDDTTDFVVYSNFIFLNPGPIARLTTQATSDPNSFLTLFSDTSNATYDYCAASANGWCSGINNPLIPSTAVPEPSVILLLATGLLGLAGLGLWRRLKASSYEYLKI